MTITQQIAHNPEVGNAQPPLAWPQPGSKSRGTQQTRKPAESQKPAESRKAAENPGQIAHDARNLLAAMGLYADLLAQPGVLNRRYAHYAGHLKVVVDSGMSLVNRLIGTRLEAPCELDATAESPSTGTIPPIEFMGDLGTAIEHRRGMLSVLMGPRIALEIECRPYPGSLRLTPVDLDRILINLVRNAGEAMPGGGRVRISVQQGAGESFQTQTGNTTAATTAAAGNKDGTGPVNGILPHVLHKIVPTLTPSDPPTSSLDESPERRGKTLLLCVQDNGPGIDPGFVNRIFDTSFTTKSLGGTTSPAGDQPGTPHAGSGSVPSSRGLGLGIVRSLVEAAGGQLRVISRVGAGTRFEIEFPLFPESAAGPHFPSTKTRDAKPETALALLKRQSNRSNKQEGSRVQC